MTDSSSKRCVLIGAPVQTGASQAGCLMGPSALRTAGIAGEIARQGWAVSDKGDLSAPPEFGITHPNPALKNLSETAGWIKSLGDATYTASLECDVPVILGGDHSLSAATVPALSKRSAARNRPLFVLWLDAHPDIHTLHTTTSGNLHGIPVGYFTGLPGFDPLPQVQNFVDPKNILMMGLRSVDPAEINHLSALGVAAMDMRAIDECGVIDPLTGFLKRVEEEDADLHVSFDVDFLDPAIAPAVGTTVPGGATFREAHLIMERLHDSGRVTSLDLVELNPFLDERGRTALLMTDLTASLFGRRILDRPTRRFD